MTSVLVVIVLLAVIGFAGWRWGADSRDGRDWAPYEDEERQPRPVLSEVDR